MENNPQKLAERIAGFLREGESGVANDFALLHKSIEQINERLFKIENSLSLNNPQSAIRNPQLPHPSQEKFEIAEAAAPTESGGQPNAEKPCPFEPTGKPCDYCSMCSSRGF